MKTKSEILDREFNFITVHIGLTVDEDLWQHDKWAVIIEGENFDYRTGIGHRKVKKGHEGGKNWKGFKDEATYYLKGSFKKDKENLIEVNKKIEYHTEVKPLNIDDVLYSLLMDSDAVDYSFSDWCDAFGYDEDSRKALKIYEACGDNSKKISKFIPNIEAAGEKFQDY